MRIADNRLTTNRYEPSRFLHRHVNSETVQPKSVSRILVSVHFFFISVRGKAPKVRKNTDGGVNPRYRNINKTKAPKGRQNAQLLCKQYIKHSVAPSGLLFVVALLPGVDTPVCVLSSLRDFGQAPLNCFSTGKPNYRRIRRGALDFPRTPIIKKAAPSFPDEAAFIIAI